MINNPNNLSIDVNTTHSRQTCKRLVKQIIYRHDYVSVFWTNCFSIHIREYQVTFIDGISSNYLNKQVYAYLF